MTCPFCLHAKSLIVDSRPSQTTIRRRRECQSCGQRWTTMEVRRETWKTMILATQAVEGEVDLSQMASGLRMLLSVVERLQEA